MTTAAEMLAAAAEYVDACRALLADPGSTVVAVRFYLGKRDLRALSRRVIGRDADLITARLVSEVAAGDDGCSRAERVFQDRWKGAFSG
jgi:hypothetical protein